MDVSKNVGLIIDKTLPDIRETEREGSCICRRNQERGNGRCLAVGLSGRGGKKRIFCDCLDLHWTHFIDKFTNTRPLQGGEEEGRKEEEGRGVGCGEAAERRKRERGVEKESRIRNYAGRPDEKREGLIRRLFIIKL